MMTSKWMLPVIGIGIFGAAFRPRARSNKPRQGARSAAAPAAVIYAVAHVGRISDVNRGYLLRDGRGWPLSLENKGPSVISRSLDEDGRRVSSGAHWRGHK
jgi:hypothetical protein